MARIFISYKRIDKEKVFDIKYDIELQTGEKCWIDILGIESDAQFKNVIIKAINECEVVLFMYSQAHSQIKDFEKDWTIRELNFARSKNKRIVFVNIDGTPLTDEFLFDYSAKQRIDGTSTDEIDRLIIDLCKWLNVEHLSPNSYNKYKLVDFRQAAGLLMPDDCFNLKINNPIHSDAKDKITTQGTNPNKRSIINVYNRSKIFFL